MPHLGTEISVIDIMENYVWKSDFNYLISVQVASLRSASSVPLSLAVSLIAGTLFTYLLHLSKVYP